jgi:hypothetical protein
MPRLVDVKKWQKRFLINNYCGLGFNLAETFLLVVT